VSEDLILGGLYGLLIGDAVGVPYEFNPPERLPALEQIDMVPPLGFASLLHCNGLDLVDFGDRLVSWYRRGYLAVDEVVCVTS
jgi:ADP-ribosyl-[dinitrogen reductase] hydrolase